MLQKILRRLSPPINTLVLLVIVCGLLIALIVKEFSIDALLLAIKKLLGVVQEAMFDQDTSVLLLFCYWLSLVVITVAFAFWLGRKSKNWEGWDFILYGRPITQDDDWMTFLELRSYAENKHGWIIMGENSYQVYDLIKGIGDAIGKGKIDIIGRYNPSHRMANDIPTSIIPIEYWKDHKIDVFDTVFWQKKNKETKTVLTTQTKIKEYEDLHINRWQVKRWLNNEGEIWKGKYAEENKDTIERQDNFQKFIDQKGEDYGLQAPVNTEEGTQP